MNITHEQWSRVFELLDAALDLPEAERAAWVDALDEGYAAVKPTLRALLVEGARIETSDFLAGLPRFAGASGGAPSPEITQIGPYRLEREIGYGGMGAVWLATRSDGLIKRPVALKLPHPGVHNRKFAARFARERDILAALTHPNIARLYDAGISNEGQPFLAMEYVEGKPLPEHCDGARLAVRPRLELFLQVLAAVQYAHANLVIHRDLKPSNVLVTPDGQVKLLDFGIAKLVIDGEANETVLTRIDGRALTPDYASPEQIAGTPISTASDVYSLGVMLYELLTGERPYKLDRDSRGALEEAILDVDALAPSEAATTDAAARARSTTRAKLAATLKGDLDTIVRKVLKKDASERYPTADAFAEDLKRYLKGDLVLAQPDRAWYRARKFALRYRLEVASFAAVVVALAAGMGMALWQAGKAREQARVAKVQAETAETVQAFMEDMFKVNSSQQPDPVKARQTTARELLDIAAKKIDTELNQAPEAKIRLLTTLGEMYDSLGLTREELDLAKKNVDVARSHYGARHPAVAQALVNLANALNMGNQAEQAQRALTEAARILDAAGDQTSSTRADLELKLATYYRQNAITEALAHADRGVAIYRTLPPSNSRTEAFYVKAMIHQELGEPGAAKAAAMEALAFLTSLGNAGEKNYLPLIHSELGYDQQDLDELAGAEASFREALEYARRFSGDESSMTLRMERSLALFLANSSRISEGIAVFERAEQIAEKLVEKGNKTIPQALTLANSAAALIEYGQLEAADVRLRRATEIGNSNDVSPTLKQNLLEIRARSLIEKGRDADAETALAGALALSQKRGRDKTPAHNGYVLLRTRLLMVTGRSDEAEKAFTEYRVKRATSGTVSRTELEQLVTRAELNLAKGNFESASQLATQAMGQIEASVNRPYLRVWQQRAALVQGKAERLAGRAGKALPVLQQALVLAAELYDPAASPVLADAQIALAECFLDLGDRRSAMALLAKARAIHATHGELGEHYRKPLRDLEARLKKTS